jgi:hypothetical protein
MKVRSTLLRLSHWAILLGPVLLLVVAFGADSLGLDSDQKWGPIRVGLVVAGSTILVLLISWRAVVFLEASQWAKIRPVGFGNRFASPLPTPMKTEATSDDGGVLPDLGPSRPLPLPVRPDPAGTTRGWIALMVLLGAIELIFVFLVSVGQWTKWPRTTQYYDLLARSFILGEISLPIEPSPLLAELDNPYDPVARRDIPVLFDASYFRAKYYAYWGPAPALVVSLLKAPTDVSIGDEQIVFAASNIALVFSALIVFSLRRRFYPSLPMWLLFASIFLVATAHPMLWILNTPKIYEAAIASGQAFLLGGLYFAIPAILGDQRQIWRLSLIGVLWTFALGSRLTLALAVAVMCIAVLGGGFSRINRRSGWQDALVRSGALLLPLLAGIALLGLYNYARFGDVLETGLRFQLTGVDYRHVFNEGGLFNVRYFLPNVAYYVLAPVTLSTTFPFVSPLWGTLPTVSSLLKGVGVPSVYHVENISGLLFSMPAIPFTAFLTYAVMRADFHRELSSQGHSAYEGGLLRGPRLNRIFLVTIFAGLGAALPSFLYYWVSNRFLLDSVPILSIAIAVLGWAAHSASRITAVRRTYAVCLIVFAVSLSFLASFLLALTGARSQFDDINPVLWNALTGLFSW